ncbi:MAG: type 1 glutamine amidotransferase [Candidatus Omnitrophica bacterium]|nr:type 1 glutamine amidotransferase [Candidatus Omnitrophota bacterium]
MRTILVVKHEKIEGAGTLEEHLIATGRPFRVVEPGETGKLPALDDCKAIVSLGGPMNVYEEERYPFLALEDEFLRGAIEHEIPTLGICLGAQLLVKCMGAKVLKADEIEIGWHPVRLAKEADSDPFFSGLPHLVETFHWHEDMFDIPRNGTSLAYSEICPNQAARIGECAWAIQFHPEMTMRMIEEWCEASPFKVDKNGFLERYRRIEKAYKKHAALLYGNFIRIADERGI